MEDLSPGDPNIEASWTRWRVQEGERQGSEEDSPPAGKLVRQLALCIRQCQEASEMEDV